MRLPGIALVCLLPVLSGCAGEPDFCELVSVEEARAVDPAIASRRMAAFDDQTLYCVYSTPGGENVFRFSIGPATRNPPVKVLETYLPRMEGRNSVERVFGVGSSAAALFSDDYGEDGFRILLANYREWSITIRARGIRDPGSVRFSALQRIGDLAIRRFD